jgi:hypothetical protein
MLPVECLAVKLVQYAIRHFVQRAEIPVETERERSALVGAFAA